MKLREHTLTPEDEERLQKACGLILYYARAIDETMLRTLNELSSEIKQEDDGTIQLLEHFLDYCATHPNAMVRHCASDMTL